MSIADAIHHRFVISFTYKKHRRVVEPHTYGLDQKRDRALSGYQIGGTSNSGKLPEFRFFFESGITDLSITKQIFNGARPDYVKDDSRFSTIFAQL